MFQKIFNMISGWLVSDDAHRTLMGFSQSDQATQPFDKRLVLDELRRAFDKSFESVDILDGKLQSLLNYTSVIVSLAGVLQFPTFLQSRSDPFLVTLIIDSMAAYGLLFYVTLRALGPRSHKNPISRSWDEIAQLYFGESEEKVLTQLIRSYLDAMENINQIAFAKSQAVRFAMKLLALIVIDIMLMALVVSLK